MTRSGALLTSALIAVVVAGAKADPPLRGRVLVLVDKSPYPELRPGLEAYFAHIRATRAHECTARPDDYAAMTPVQIRDLLRSEYQRPDAAPLRGAIFVGPLPHALKGVPGEVLMPLTLFYEDFDARYDDRNGDGVYEADEITNDRVHNPTEIWTSWWVPPAMEPARRVELLKSWLAKLDRYYRGELPGRDQMLWLAGNVSNVEICEGWTVLLKDSMRPLEQRLWIWSRIGQDEGTFRPNKRKDEFGPRDFWAAFSLQPWQHLHVITHGNPRGWYWESCGVVGAPAPDDRPEAVLRLPLGELAGGGANIVTTSGCSNGNFRGDLLQPAYDRSLGNLLLFSPDTNTVAYYGAASPQSTSGFAGYCTELIESLRADGGSFIAEGYQRLRNADYSWGTEHYFFRGGDEKILSGDPFARYRDSAPASPEERRRIAEKITAAGWTVVGPG